MNIWSKRAAVKHPDWVLDAAGSISTTAALYAKRHLPPCIETAMIVVPTRRLLRGVYGSDLRAALVLLGIALSELPEKTRLRLKWFWLFTVLRKDREKYCDEQLTKIALEDALEDEE